MRSLSASAYTISQTSGQISDTSRVIQLLELHEAMIATKPEVAKAYAQAALELATAIDFYHGQINSQLAIGYLNHKKANYDSALHYFDMAFSLASDHQYHKKVLEALSSKGKTLRSMSQWEGALTVFKQALKLSQSEKNAIWQAKTHNNLGNIYLDKHDFLAALDHYQKSRELYEEHSLELAMVLRNIGLVYYRTDDYRKSFEYCQQALELSDQHSDLSLKSHILQLMGIVQRALGNFDQVLPYYLESLRIVESLNETRKTSQLQSNIGNFYFDLKDYRSAMQYYLKALEVQIQTDNKTDQCYTLVAIGNTHMQLNEIELAKKRTHEAQILAKKIGIPLIYMDASEILSEIYAHQNDYKSALHYYVEFKNISDSLFNEQKTGQLAEMAARFESQQKEKEINLLSAQNEINQLKITKGENLRNYLTLVSLFVIIIALILYSRYKIKTKANKKLEELDEIKTHFFTNVSHEFRTPLTLILGPLERLIHKESHGSKKVLYKMMHNNAARLLELVNQLLDLSKLDAGSMKLNLSKANINTFIASLSHSFWSLAEQKEINLNIEISQEESIISFDRDKLHKVIYNLLSNAIKFTPKGGQVSITAGQLGEDYQIVVADNGIGIPKNKIKQLFERFSQVNLDHSIGGTGIGLALTKELVALHQGNIEVDSEENIGTSFKVTVPIWDQAVVESKTITSIAETITLKNPDSDTLNQKCFSVERESILVVDDNNDVRRYVKSIFQDEYDLFEAMNGKEGLTIAHEKLPDLIVSDLMMPEMNGIEFCQKIKTDELTSHIPVILLTAKADLDSKILGLKTGADDYVLKPFKEEELKVRALNLITQRKTLRERFGDMIFLEPSSISITPPDKEFIEKVQTIVEQNISNLDFTVEQFQREAGMSRMQLHRKLKALVNSSASEFIRNQRLKRASQLLESEALNISEVAYASGFNNVSYFAKCFREKFALPPSEYVANPEKWVSNQRNS
ncbi:MAG: tetratricopeptide repeat protein [Reichenbachiella sp.]|uniref:tetratricopeptide repeat protein n=1 Tax=Reichenbachiella sp. TaxID=2184521 RepID=UPI003264D4B1